MKKEYISFHVQINDAGDADYGIDVSTHGGGKAVPTERVTEINKYPYVDRFNQWYGRSAPRDKIMPQTMTSHLATAKNSSCTRLDFRLYVKTGNVMICSWNGHELVQSDLLDSGASNIEYIQESDINSGFFLKSVLLQQNEWIMQVPKLSPKAVTQVYMDPENPDYPLMLVIFHGTQGMARFVIPNIYG